MLMALRINVLAKGYSGVSPETLEQFVQALNADCIPWVPEVCTKSPYIIIFLQKLIRRELWVHQEI